MGLVEEAGVQGGAKGIGAIQGAGADDALEARDGLEAFGGDAEDGSEAAFEMAPAGAGAAGNGFDGFMGPGVVEARGGRVEPGIGLAVEGEAIGEQAGDEGSGGNKGWGAENGFDGGGGGWPEVGQIGGAVEEVRFGDGHEVAGGSGAEADGEEIHGARGKELYGAGAEAKKVGARTGLGRRVAGGRREGEGCGAVEEEVDAGAGKKERQGAGAGSGPEAFDEGREPGGGENGSAADHREVGGCRWRLKKNFVLHEPNSESRIQDSE